MTFRLKETIEKLKLSFCNCDNIISLSHVGSSTIGTIENNYLDIDLIFIISDKQIFKTLELIDKQFSTLCKNFSNKDQKYIYRLQSGPMHPIRDKEESNIINLIDQQITFYHISIFNESFIKNENELSPFLANTWSKYDSIFGERIIDLVGSSEINFEKLLNAGLGLKDSLKILTDRKRGYWEWVNAKLVWTEVKFSDFDFYEMPLYIFKWTVHNSIHTLKEHLPLKSSNKGLECFKRLFSNIIDTNDLDFIERCLRELKISREKFSAGQSYAELKETADRLISTVSHLLQNLIEYFEVSNLNLTSRLNFRINEIEVPINLVYDIKNQIIQVINSHNPDRICIVQDHNVTLTYCINEMIKDSFDVETFSYTILSTASTKSIDGLIKSLEYLESSNINRKSLVFIFGGGSIGNMIGTALGLSCRGIPFVHIPTSLMSQVDSSIGAKQSINGRLGKNYFGLFHPPKEIIVCPYLLTNLPNSEIRNGLIECLKHGFCQSPKLLNKVLNYSSTDLLNLSVLHEIILETIQLKLEYMIIDPFENSSDQFLELGHKIGHALEFLANGQLTHGESVAFGLIAESFLFVDLGLSSQETHDKIVKCTQKVINQISIPENVNSNSIASQLKYDNHREGNLVPFSYLKNIHCPKSKMLNLNKENIKLISKATLKAIEIYCP